MKGIRDKLQQGKSSLVIRKEKLIMTVVKYWNRLSWEQAQLTNLTSQHPALRVRLRLEEVWIPPALTFSIFFASKFESSCAFWRSNVKAQWKKSHIFNEACLCPLSNPEGTASAESEACCWVWCEQAPAVHSTSISVILQVLKNQSALWNPANNKSNHVFSPYQQETITPHS